MLSLEIEALTGAAALAGGICAAATANAIAAERARFRNSIKKTHTFHKKNASDPKSPHPQAAWQAGSTGPKARAPRRCRQRSDEKIIPYPRWQAQYGKSTNSAAAGSGKDFEILLFKSRKL